MITHEAVCEGCGYRAAAIGGRRHPKEWTALISPTGKRYFCSDACMREKVAGPERPVVPASVSAHLTDRDVRVLTLIAQGKRNKEIGAATGVTTRTIKGRLTAIAAHLGGQDRCQLILLADAAGIINLHQLAQRFAQAKNGRAA
jgi:DNA-binding NarL/FixJ family response regulator